MLAAPLTRIPAVRSCERTSRLGGERDCIIAKRPSPEPAAEPAKRKRVALYAEITPEARRQLRILAAEQDTRIEALVAEALNLLFEKHGKPPAA